MTTCRAVLLGTAALIGGAPYVLAQHSRPARIALIFTTSHPSEMAGPNPSHPSVRAFVHALRDLGYQEGRNLVFDRRTAEGKLERLNDIVADLVRLKTDVIVAVGHPSIIPAAKTVTAPIVLVPSFFDPVEAGLVESFARPGRNVTGLTITPSAEIEGKRLELLKEALPRLQLVALLGMAADWDDAFGQAIQRAARQLGIRVFHAVPLTHRLQWCLRLHSSAAPRCLDCRQHSGQLRESEAHCGVHDRQPPPRHVQPG